ncbi:uncharacterized protein LOC111904062 [Lactuca sativa]|uniref:uncharacterized protein LOC111904062 n=1 Tax=Lactuca sativa TaxID=4236 RepID=UPI000CD9D4EC|nr:uncharacterized protein LOC111904062 [Lactuca sativa]
MITRKRQIEKVESVFEICECPEEVKVKFSACTFVDQALTWWNGHVEAMTLPISNVMPWAKLKEMLMVEYCPRSEIQKMEQELWNLTVRNSDIDAYISRLTELSLLCPGNVTAANPENFDSAKRLANKLYDHNNKKGKKQGKLKARRRVITRRENNKRKERQGSESSKKQQTVTVHAATT